MDDFDFLFLYLNSNFSVNSKTFTEAKNSTYSVLDILKYFQDKNPDITKKNYLKWYEDLHLDLEKNNNSILSSNSQIYPDSLKSISGYPKYLFYKGNIDLLNKEIFAVVGTRNPTNFGIKNAQNIVSDLSKSGFVIVSGMALGMDSIAHQNSLKNGTIAVLGSGLNCIYPKSNTSLFNKIIDSDGLILSEYLPDTTPLPQYFPRRSRIIAGLASGLLVTEAAKKSGSLIAAGFAFEYGRNVYAIPGDINRENTAGCNYLIKKNIAKLIDNVEDILEDYPDKILNKNIKHVNDLDPKTIEIIEKIKAGITDIDALIKNVDLNYSEFLGKISFLELNGYLSRVDSDLYLNV